MKCLNAIRVSAGRRRAAITITGALPLALISALASAQAPTTGPAATPAVPATQVAMVDTPSIAATGVPPPPAPPPGPPPPPYSLPWQLRPVTVGNVVRSDTSTALYKDSAGNTGTTVVTMLVASYKVTPELAPMIKLGFSHNGAPGTMADGSSFVNPIVGATYAHKLGSFRLAGFLATTIPIGTGAGNTPNLGAAGAATAGVAARSGMDNAMFAVNYMTGIAGVGFAYVDHKFTAQVEATLLELFRVKGDAATPMNLTATDSTRTNSTVGLHLGYFVIPQLSFGGEIRYQRCLSTITRLNAMGIKSNIPDVNKDTVTFAVGPRAHFKMSKSMWVRPGISYSRGLDEPLNSATAARVGSYNMVQVDVPVIF